MSVLASITEGWKGQLGPFICKANGLAFNLTGMTPKLWIRDTDGSMYNADGATSLGTPTLGQVYYQPTGNEFAANGGKSRTYNVHIGVTDQANNVIFFPNGQPDQIVVWPK